MSYQVNYETPTGPREVICESFIDILEALAKRANRAELELMQATSLEIIVTPGMSINIVANEVIYKVTNIGRGARRRDWVEVSQI
jgi:hypothetical protein